METCSCHLWANLRETKGYTTCKLYAIEKTDCRLFNHTLYGMFSSTNVQWGSTVVKTVIKYWSMIIFYVLNVGFYLALFQYWSKRFTFNSVAVGILSAALQCPRYTHTFGRRSIDFIPSNYLITPRSTKQSRLSILPMDTNTLALAGLELTV